MVKKTVVYQWNSLVAYLTFYCFLCHIFRKLNLLCDRKFRAYASMLLHYGLLVVGDDCMMIL